MTESFKVDLTLLIVFLIGIVLLWVFVKNNYILKIPILCLYLFIAFKFYQNVRKYPYHIKKMEFVEELRNLNENKIDSLRISTRIGKFSFYKGDTLLIPFFKEINKSKPVDFSGRWAGSITESYYITIYYKNLPICFDYFADSAIGSFIKIIVCPGSYIYDLRIDYRFKSIIDKIIEQRNQSKI